jgi:undecaprenyl diphosphate synthase
MQALARRVADGELEPADIDEAAVAEQLSTAGLPDPDLLIRTGGDMRVSNFLLWQIAYAELWVTPVPWPEFRKEHLLEALDAFAQRQRRFGRTGDQVPPGPDEPRGDAAPSLKAEDPKALREAMAVGGEVG